MRNNKTSNSIGWILCIVFLLAGAGAVLYVQQATQRQSTALRSIQPLKPGKHVVPEPPPAEQSYSSNNPAVLNASRGKPALEQIAQPHVENTPLSLTTLQQMFPQFHHEPYEQAGLNPLMLPFRYEDP